MPQFIALPDEVAAVFGSASAKFVDFLNSSFSFQKEDVITVSATHFENRLVRETSEIRLEVAELRSETKTAIAEVRTEIAGVRAEMKADFASVHKEIAGIHREISVQTRWMLGGLAAAVTLYPIITRLVARVLP